VTHLTKALQEAWDATPEDEREVALEVATHTLGNLQGYPGIGTSVYGRSMEDDRRYLAAALLRFRRDDSLLVAARTWIANGGRL
jgi:hypothetical protein